MELRNLNFGTVSIDSIGTPIKHTHKQITVTTLPFLYMLKMSHMSFTLLTMLFNLPIVLVITHLHTACGSDEIA